MNIHKLDNLVAVFWLLILERRKKLGENKLISVIKEAKIETFRVYLWVFFILIFYSSCICNGKSRK